MRGIHTLRGKEPILQKIVFELRYRHGFMYLDRCGRMINTIIREYPEWTIDPSNPNPQGATLVSLANSCVLSVGTRKLDLAIEMPLGGEPLREDDVTDVADQVDTTTAVVVDLLDLTDFSRIGCRLWYLFPCQNQQEAESWLASLGCYSVSDGLKAAFGGATEAIGISVVISGEDRKYRIAFNGVQRAATVDVGKEVLNVRAKDLPVDQRKMLLEQEKAKSRLRQAPDFPAMIDIYAFVEDPESPDPRAFVITTHKTALEQLRKAVGG